MSLDLSKVRGITWTMAVMISLAIICSGVLFIFIFKNDVYIKTDLIKLILLCTSITLPIWIINTFMIQILGEKKDYVNDDELQFVAMLGCAVTILIIYVPIILKFYLRISLCIGISFILISEFIIVLYSAIKIKKNVKESN